MKKIVFSGLLAGFIMLVLNILFNFATMKFCPSIIAQYNNPELYRSMKDPITMLFFVHPFLVGMVLAFVWDKTKVLFTAKKFLCRGSQFGLMYMLVVLPGLFISYVSSPYTIEVVASWGVNVLITSVAAGILFEKVNA